MAWLRDNGYTSLTPSNLYEAIYNDLPLPDKPVMITVDDGYRSDLLFAEIVTSYGFRPVFFWPNYAELSKEEMQYLASLGEACGHTVSHAALSQLSWEGQYAELAPNKAWIEEQLGYPIRCFAYPFGAYEYSSQLGYKIGGKVPFNIPTSWFYMLVASLAICARILPAKDDRTSKWWWAFVGGVVLTLWDVSMDPAMVKTNHWFWEMGTLADRHPFVRFIGAPIFYGMPLTNWLGWLLTGVLVARAMLAVVPPTVWAAKIAPHRLPFVLYAVNGLLPIAICLRWDMVPAGILGFIAMAVPLWAALRQAPGYKPQVKPGSVPLPSSR